MRSHATRTVEGVEVLLSLHRVVASQEEIVQPALVEEEGGGELEGREVVHRLELTGDRQAKEDDGYREDVLYDERADSASGVVEALYEERPVLGQPETEVG